jgi:hypothetical protein
VVEAVPLESTRPDAMSISWTVPDNTVPCLGPPSADRSAAIGRKAVISAVSCGVMTNSCRSAWSPWPALTVAMVPYELSAITAWPSP